MIYEGKVVYVKSVPDDGSRTPARLVTVTKESVSVKYHHIRGTFTFSRNNVVDEDDNILPFKDDDQ